MTGILRVAQDHESDPRSENRRSIRCNATLPSVMADRGMEEAPLRPRAAGEPPAVARWRLLGVLTLVQTGLSCLQLAPVALLPVIKTDLDLSVTRTVVFASAVNAGALLAAVPAGQITNRFGERRTLTVGAAVAGLALLVAMLLPDPRWMIPPLLVAGFGVVTSHPAGIRLIMRHFAVRERGGAIALRQTAVPLGGAAAALILPPLAPLIGWRGGLAVVGCLALTLAALARLALPPDDGDHTTGAAAAGGFLAVLRRPGVARGVLISLCLNVGQVAVVTFVALYAHDGLGRSVVFGAALLALVQGGGVVGRILWGVVSDRLYGGRRRPLLIWLGAGSVAAVAAFGVVGAGTPPAVLLLLALAAGLTAVAWNGLAIALTTEAAGIAGAATAMSFIVLVVSLANAAVPVIGGVIVDTSGSYRPVWFATAAVILIAPALTLLAKEKPDAAAGSGDIRPSKVARLEDRSDRS
jgi:predicted MFS family arabinose efflux permease